MARRDWVDRVRRASAFDTLADTGWATTVKRAPTTRRGYRKRHGISRVDHVSPDG
jgi:hypothetical protein